MTLTVSAEASMGKAKRVKHKNKRVCRIRNKTNTLHVHFSFEAVATHFLYSLALSPLLISSFSFKFNEKNLSLHIFCRFYNLNMKFFIRRMIRVAKSLFAFVCICFLFQLRFHRSLFFLSLLLTFFMPFSSCYDCDRSGILV